MARLSDGFRNFLKANFRHPGQAEQFSRILEERPTEEEVRGMIIEAVEQMKLEILEELTAKPQVNPQSST